MKNANKNGNKNSANVTVKTPLAMDPISVAKRKLDEARIDYKRIKEINAGPKAEKQANPERVGIREKLVSIKTIRQAASDEIKAAKALIIEKRKECKLISQQKKELEGSVKKVPRVAKSKAVGEAQVALLEAELAYRKACIG